MSNPAGFSIINALAYFSITLEPSLISDIAVQNIVNDSRKVQTGDVFCAVYGSLSDGRNYIEKAILQGAVLILAQTDNQKEHGQISHQNNVPVVGFFQLDALLGELADLYYNRPLTQLTTIGVTGTNGKTSTSHIIASLLEFCGYKAAVIGTTGAGQLAELVPIANTTPGPTELSQLLANFVEQEISHVAMEVSSHALVQHRIKSTMLDVAVFTNLSRDHLDYHGSMRAYAEAKFSIFAANTGQVAIINGDDEVGQQWLKRLEQPTVVYGKSPDVTKADDYLYAKDIQFSLTGVSFTVVTPTENTQFMSKLLGAFNVDNLLAGIAVLRALGVSLEHIALAVAHIKPIHGRMELFQQQGKPSTVVDYAHTPDALINALTACRQHCGGKLWVVFGCGGERDKGKRPLMGKAAENMADHVVLTNDNPRSEDPEIISQDILSGCQHPERIQRLLDRDKAVRTTIAQAGTNDVVLLAGKGHETTITIGTEMLDYSERALVQSIYQQEICA